MATNTLRPKKNGKPQSKTPAFGPPSVGNTKSPAIENSWLALPMVKFTTLLVVPLAIVAYRFTGDDGQ